MTRIEEDARKVRFRKRIVRVSLAVAALVLPFLEAREVRTPEAKDLAGLWRAKRHFGPEVKGALTIQRDGAGFRAEIKGRTAPAKLDHGRLSFELAGGEGSFRGRLTKSRIRYGYLWWVTEYPYRNRTVRAFFAGGNGGQVVMGIPELDLVIAFYGGNYSDPALFKPQRVFVPEYILPAVK